MEFETREIEVFGTIDAVEFETVESFLARGGKVTVV